VLNPSLVELGSLSDLENYVRHGVQTLASFKSLLRFGRRPRQTLLSFADAAASPTRPLDLSAPLWSSVHNP
jgi:hypothetical protein